MEILCINKSEVLTHYCIIRKDLPIGAAMAQLIHAAGESSPGNLSEGTYAICLAVKDEQQLLELEAILKNFNIPHKAIREPDPPYNGALMAIGCVPAPRSILRPYLSSLPLYK